MAENSNIEWTDHTVNFWMGCMKVNEACKFCYAESFTQRYFGKNLWGPESDRHITKGAWKDPFKWDKKAKEMGIRPRVFCSSLSDFFEDNELINETRVKAWDVIRKTVNLDWLILTKRPQNIKRFLPEDWGQGWDNVILGTSIGLDSHINFAADLIATPSKRRFLSMEPLLGYPEKLNAVLKTGGIHWVIVGGESGMKKDVRPFNIEWARKIQSDCKEHNVAFFMKQLGANPVYPSSKTHKLEKFELPTYDRKGDKLETIPVDLQVRQFPDHV
jgi:protein gp37